MRYLHFVAALAAAATPAAAQTSAYADQPPRAIAALSDDDVRQLLDGAGMGYALAAELNGIAGPRHVLELADSLHLSDAQRAIVDASFRRMQQEARRLGAEIVRLETELDSLFASGEMTAARVEERTLELGRLNGRLRGVHLVAHLETAAALTPHQVERYVRLRGYAASANSAAHGAHH